jgi:integrase/recombinase XerC
MYRRVFRQKGSRVYRVRYRLSDGPKIYDAPLRTHVKEVAEAKARQLVEDAERELAGLLGPKSLRDAALRPLKEHTAEFIADLTARSRGRSHLVHVKCRLERLLKDCRWHQLRDVSAESFIRWRQKQADLSAKTLNEYLGHASALLSWMIRHNRAAYNPFKSVPKVDKKETFRRRALTLDEFWRLVESSGKRRFPYLVAGCTGLRRGELKKLLWSDIRLDEPQPFIDVRAEITKAKRAAIIPLVPPLVAQLRARKANAADLQGRVFPRGLPSVKSLQGDLVACGIPVEDERGYRLDFHSLRHTFASILASVGVSELARVKLARHSEWRQTDRYTDPKSLPLFTEMAKFATALPSSIASPNFGFSCPNKEKPVPDQVSDCAKVDGDNALETSDLSAGVLVCETENDGARGGTRTPMLLRHRLLRPACLPIPPPGREEGLKRQI